MTMTLFPEIVVSWLVVGSLVAVAAGVITLVVLLWKDFRKEEIW